MRPGARKGFAWTRENILYAAERFHRKNGRAPTCTDWARATDDNPTAEHVRYRFGSFVAMLQAAGLRSRWARRLPQHQLVVGSVLRSSYRPTSVGRVTRLTDRYAWLAPVQPGGHRRRVRRDRIRGRTYEVLA